MSTIRIVAEISITPGERGGLMPALQSLVEGSRSEPGNRAYDLTEDIAHPGHFFVIEEWLSEQAIAEHNESAHFRAFVAAIDGKTEKLSITKLKTVF